MGVTKWKLSIALFWLPRWNQVETLNSHNKWLTNSKAMKSLKSLSSSLLTHPTVWKIIVSSQFQAVSSKQIFPPSAGSKTFFLSIKRVYKVLMRLMLYSFTECEASRKFNEPSLLVSKSCTSVFAFVCLTTILRSGNNAMTLIRMRTVWRAISLSDNLEFFLQWLSTKTWSLSLHAGLLSPVLMFNEPAVWISA